MAQPIEDINESGKVIRREAAQLGGFIYLLQHSSGERKYVRWESLPADAQSDYLRRFSHAAKEEKASRLVPAEHLKRAKSRFRRAQTEKKSGQRGKEQRRKASKTAGQHRYIVVVHGITKQHLLQATSIFSQSTCRRRCADHRRIEAVLANTCFCAA
jgi:hypothetical protein